VVSEEQMGAQGLKAELDKLKAVVVEKEADTVKWQKEAAHLKQVAEKAMDNADRATDLLRKVGC
jgi:hypothetical protein